MKKGRKEKERHNLLDRLVNVEAQVSRQSQGGRVKKLRSCGCETVESKVRDPLHWLQYHTETKDPHWREVGALSPFRPFPDQAYFRPILQRWQREQVLFCAKSRDLMMSWLFVGLFLHECMTNPGVEVLFQSQTEEKAAELVEYARCLYVRQNADIKARYPLAQPEELQSRFELNFRNNSRIVGIPHGADKIRSYHPTALFMDEAAFVPDAGQSFDEAIAACQKITVLSSANTGWFESVVVSAESDVTKIVTGLTEQRTPDGICVLRVHYSADPDRAKPEWKERERRKYTSESSWQSEQEIVFGAGGGERLFADILARYADKIIIDPETSGFQPSPYWNYFGGFDAGKANPTAALVACTDYDGVIYILREYYLPGLSPLQHAHFLKQLQGFTKGRVYSDPSIFYANQAQNDGTFKAIAALYAEAGIDKLTPAPDNNELLGMERILAHWMNLDEREPTLRIVCPRATQDLAKPRYGVHNEGCPNLLWELRRARRAELTPNQLSNKNPTEKIVDKDNHLRDCLKYMVLAYPEAAEETFEMKAKKIVGPLIEQNDPTSAYIRYLQVKAEEEVRTRGGLVFLGRYARSRYRGRRRF